tara:strand:+ start:1152 stop:1829 length:678 start_codon:yes stop_codon:yes gene_type:complete
MVHNKNIKKILALLLILFFQQNIIYANIVYDKDNILITELELEEFKKLYFQNKKIELNKLKAIKELVLLKKTIIQLEENQPDALKTLDDLIINEFGENRFNNPVNRDFLRYSKIRNEFIIQYFNHELKVDDIEITLSSFSDLNMPLSSNGCKTVSNYINLKNNIEFIESLYKNFKKNRRNFEIKVEDKIFNVCINDKVFSIIEKKLINYLEIKTENRFKAFIYEK